MSEIIYQDYPMVDYSEFLPEILLEFPELPEDIATHYIRQSCISIAKDWRGLTRDVPINLFPCVPDYQVEFDCVDPVAIVAVVSGDKGCPTRHYDYRPPNGIMVHPTPTVESTVMLRFMVSPREDSCEVDAVMFYTHKELVQYGVRYRLYQMPRKPWTDINAAQYFQEQYRVELAKASTDRLMDGKLGPIPIQHFMQRRRCRL